MVYFLQAGVLFSIVKIFFCPIFVANLHTFGELCIGLNSAVVYQNGQISGMSMIDLCMTSHDLHARNGIQ